MGQLTLVLGDAFSGKSAFAKTLFPETARVLFIATLQPANDGQKRQIAKLRSERPPLWSTVEAPWQVPQVLQHCGYQYDGFIVDSITHYVWNLLAKAGKERTDDQLMIEIGRTVGAAQLAKDPVAIVTGDVAGGVASSDPNARRYQELVSRANRRLVEDADQVFALRAGKADRVK